MMKLIHQLAVAGLLSAALCAAAAARAAGVSVPQRSAADYFFTVPRLTNHIQGVIIDPSEPTNSYRVIRSEDVDWFLEAFRERAILQSGGFTHQVPGTGAHVNDPAFTAGYVFWNGSPRGSDGGWLDPDVPLLMGIRTCGWIGGEVWTNVYTVASYTNGYTNAFSTIEMPLTNGTTSVFTNAWRAPMRFPTTVTHTNAHAASLLDYCQPEGAGAFGGYTNCPSQALSLPFPTLSEFTNAVSALRGTKRLADVGVSHTNDTVSIDETAHDGTLYQATTNSVVGGIAYELHAECNTNGSWWADASYTKPFTAVIPTRFDSSLVTTGGASRVAVEAVFMNMYVFFTHYDHGTQDLFIQTNAVIRISGTLNTGSQKAVVLAHVDPKSICSSVANAVGASSVPEAGVYYKPGSGESFLWSAAADRFVVIYSITPSVKLQDW